MTLTDTQAQKLLAPINAGRVRRDNKGFSYVEIHDVIATLTRIFGFGGWSKEVTELTCVAESSAPDPKKDNRLGWTVTYLARVRLTIRDPQGNVVGTYEDAATGTGNNQPERGEAHDLACKNAVSYAVKRAAKDLGDQFGLSLYNDGSLDAFVVRVLAGPGAPKPEPQQPEPTAAPSQPVPVVEPPRDQREDVRAAIGRLAESRGWDEQTLAADFRQAMGMEYADASSVPLKAYRTLLATGVAADPQAVPA